jgi:hypothetical protein
MVVTKGKSAFRTLELVARHPIHRRDPVRISLRSLSDAVRWLTGSGAVRNARGEVVDAAATVVDLEAQLRRVVDPTPRRAA